MNKKFKKSMSIAIDVIMFVGFWVLIAIMIYKNIDFVHIMSAALFSTIPIISLIRTYYENRKSK